MRRWLPWTAFLLLAFWTVSCTAFLDFKPGRDADTPDDGRDIDADMDLADEAGDADPADDPAPDRDEGRDDGPEGETAPDTLDVPDAPQDEAVETDAMEECLAPSCVLGGSCYGEGTPDPYNVCRYCHVGTWIPRPDGSECGTGNLCCSGECEADAECCTALQCPEDCLGTAAPCATYYYDAALCAAHLGCTAQGVCGPGVNVDCTAVTSTYCEICGCTWTTSCESVELVPCSGQDGNYYNCTYCGCTYSLTACAGTPLPCSDFNADTCGLQQGCSWARRPCTDHHCEP